MRVCTCIVALIFSMFAVGHEIRPALLQLTETTAYGYDVVWKRPVNAGRTLNLSLEFPAHCLAKSTEVDQISGAAWVSHMRLECEGGGLRGHTIAIPDLSRTLTDALVRITWQDGTMLNQVLRSEQPLLTLDVESTAGLLDYLWLGIEHLLTGFDHVLFVIGLLYLGRTGWRLVQIVTSFTLAHSFTLGLSAIELIKLPQSPVEAVIALSILFLAVELAKNKKNSLLFQKPWLIAFIFGLLHGFGFAGALRDIGLPSDSLLAALFLFNVGVEVGQLIVVAIGLLVVLIVRQYAVRVHQQLAAIPVWMIGCLAAYWFIERTYAVVLA